MAKVTAELRGGIEMQDKPKLDAEIAEKFEKRNERTADNFDLLLGEVLKADPGGFVTNRLFYVAVPGSPDRPDEIMFDRWYFNQNLLVDLYQEPRSEYEKERTNAEIAKKRAYVKEHHINYLPVVGSISVAEVHEAVKAAA